mmetsp:Transcript_22966/g.54898  ORF Transcript_22966/g.54898 Transcript_22966/m.54898 type:complete len:247 (+) Transcript_22966:76-816(+)
MLPASNMMIAGMPSPRSCARSVAREEASFCVNLCFDPGVLLMYLRMLANGESSAPPWALSSKKVRMPPSNAAYLSDILSTGASLAEPPAGSSVRARFAGAAFAAGLFAPFPLAGDLADLSVLESPSRAARFRARSSDPVFLSTSPLPSLSSSSLSSSSSSSLSPPFLGLATPSSASSIMISRSSIGVSLVSAYIMIRYAARTSRSSMRCPRRSLQCAVESRMIVSSVRGVMGRAPPAISCCDRSSA